MSKERRVSVFRMSCRRKRVYSDKKALCNIFYLYFSTNESNDVYKKKSLWFVLEECDVETHNSCQHTVSVEDKRMSSVLIITNNIFLRQKREKFLNFQ